MRGQMLRWWHTYWQDLLSLVYPEHCRGCQAPLTEQENKICLVCTQQLTLPDLLPADGNLRQRPGFTHFWPYAHWVLMHYQKGGSSQRLIHQLKYHNQPELGLVLGKMMGEAMLLASSAQRPLPDWIVPVPLHASRFRKRGYNQAGQLALGIAEALQKPSVEAVLLRPNYTESQTTKNREQRLKAMQQVFEVETNPDLLGKHVLLVDDVLTTGATLGACGEALLKAGAAYVSIAILAVAD